VRGPVHVGPGETAIIVLARQADPALVLLALDGRFAGVALRVERVEFLLEPFFSAFAGADGGDVLFVVLSARFSAAYSSMIDSQPCSSAYRWVPAKMRACRFRDHFKSNFSATRRLRGLGKPVVNTNNIVAKPVFSTGTMMNCPVNIEVR